MTTDSDDGEPQGRNLLFSLASNELQHLNAVFLTGALSASVFVALGYQYDVLHTSQGYSTTFFGVTSVAVNLWLFAIAHAVHVIDDRAEFRLSLKLWAFALLGACTSWAALSLTVADAKDSNDRTPLWMFPLCLLVYYECYFFAVAVVLGRKHARFVLPLFVVPGITSCISAVLFYIWISAKCLESSQALMAIVSAVVYPAMRLCLRSFFLSVVSRKIMRRSSTTNDNYGSDLRTYGTLARALSMNFTTPGQALLALLPDRQTFLLSKLFEAAIEIAAAEVTLQMFKRRITSGFTGLLKEAREHEREGGKASDTAVSPAAEESEGKGDATTLTDAEFAVKLREFSKRALEERLAQEDIGEKSAAVISVLAGTLAIRALKGSESFGVVEIVVRIAFSLAVEMAGDVIKCWRAASGFGVRPDLVAIKIDGNTVVQISTMSLCVAFISFTGVQLFY